MVEVKEYISNCADNPPEWYWVYGLHDACIRQIESFEFPFDYNRFIKEKSKYNRNCLSLKMNARGALYDNSIKGIRFYNYRVLGDHTSLNDKRDLWWKSDRLSYQEGLFTLEIDLKDYHSDPEDLTVKIEFESAEVDRE